MGGPPPREDSRDRALRLQEIGWLLQNMQSRIHHLERDQRRSDPKSRERVRIEGKLSSMYALRSDLQSRQARLVGMNESEEVNKW
jgi:hypothetical protein